MEDNLISNVKENNPQMMSATSKIDSYTHKGKNVARLVSPTGKTVEIVPAMTNVGTRFFLYIDKELEYAPTGKEFWQLKDLINKISTLEIPQSDIKILSNKISDTDKDMSDKFKNKKLAKPTAAQGFALEETAGFEFFEDEETITQVNESINNSFKDDNSNVPIPNKEPEPVVEGQYLQSGLSTREAPIPFTQDPECEGVPDYLNDEQKAGIHAPVVSAGSTDSGDVMEESILDQFKKGDAVCIDRVMNVEWLVESVSANPDKMVVKNGKRTKIVSPSTTFIEHADGANIHKERQLENLDALKEAYMKMTFEEDKRALKANWCTYEEGKSPEKIESTLPILEREQMYSFIKGNDLHKTDEVAAYQSICEKYGNPISEIEKIMEDAKCSEANEKVDSMYNFNATPYEENSIGLATTLEAAWQEMEKKELEETAKLSDEQPGANGGGLGPKQIKFNL